MKSIFFSLLLNAYLICFVQSDCKVVINEANIIDQKLGKNEFIELKSTCESDIPLRGYKLIGLNCQSETTDSIVTLWNHRMNKDGFFTISGSGITTADLKHPSEYIKFKNIFDGKNTQSILNFFANDKKQLRAIGLLYDKEKNNPFSDFILSKQQLNIAINDEIFMQLKKILIDVIVYGECDKCKLIEKINDEFTSKKYILRDFPSNSEKNEIS